MLMCIGAGLLRLKSYCGLGFDPASVRRPVIVCKFIILVSYTAIIITLQPREQRFLTSTGSF